MRHASRIGSVMAARMPVAVVGVVPGAPDGSGQHPRRDEAALEQRRDNQRGAADDLLECRRRTRRSPRRGGRWTSGHGVSSPVMPTAGRACPWARTVK